MATHVTQFALGDHVADTLTGERGVIVEITLSLDAMDRYTVEFDTSPDAGDVFSGASRQLTARRLDKRPRPAGTSASAAQGVGR